MVYLSLSFNPCFGGSYIVTGILQSEDGSSWSFNPCFGGSYIVTLHPYPH